MTLSHAPAVDDATPAAGDDGGGWAYYVFGIAPFTGQLMTGLPDEAMAPGCPVYALAHGDMQVVVSGVPLAEFGKERLESNLRNLDWVRTKALAHQSVLAAVCAGHTVIPIKFCTLFSDENRVCAMLDEHHEDFRATLAQLAGKQEWGVKAYCDDAVLGQHVGQVSDRVKELQSTMAQKSPGAAYFLKKTLARVVEEESERVKDEYAQCSHDRLSRHGFASVVCELQDPATTGRREQMVLNGAYLVAQEQLAPFRAELETMAEEYGPPGFRYEMTGPWPAYNFTTTGVTKVGSDG